MNIDLSALQTLPENEPLVRAALRPPTGFPPTCYPNTCLEDTDIVIRPEWRSVRQ